MTAEGAIRQALSRLDDIPGETRIGFYKGLTGVAYALTEASQLLAIPKFGPMAILLIEEIYKGLQAKQEIDVLSGAAGAITPLLSIQDRLSHDLPLELAVQQGERLLDRSVSARGFAEGIEGVEWALSELYHVTGSSRFRRGGMTAVHGGTPLQTRWLDGEAGTAMALIRRFELSCETALMTAAESNVETVAKRLSAITLDLGGNDFSPAYGITGEAELLLDAGTILDRPPLVELARRVGCFGIECFRKDDMPWPCGESDGEENPGLMTGLAGIGHFYLRLSDRERTSSLLLVRPV